MKTNMSLTESIYKPKFKLNLMIRLCYVWSQINPFTYCKKEMINKILCLFWHKYIRIYKLLEKREWYSIYQCNWKCIRCLDEYELKIIK